MYKTTYRIILNKVEKVKAFCRICMEHENSVTAKDGMYTVNAKSILGLFSLDLVNPISVTFYGPIDSNIKKEIVKYSISANRDLLHLKKD